MKFFSSVKMNIIEFNEIFKSYIEDLSISQPPIEIDSIFIGDASNSYFKKVDYLFILGAQKVSFHTQDLGIISDSEIALLNKNYKLSPTIELINKRKKFKIFELIFMANKEVNFFYVSSTSSGEECYPSAFLRSLKDLGVLNINSGKTFFDISKMLSNKTDKLLNYNDLNFAIDDFISALKYWEVFYDNIYYRENINYLYSILKNFNANQLIENNNYKNLIRNLDDNCNFFFKDKKISISEFECYFKCPYMHYCTYGLKLKDNKKELDNRVYGNLIHEFLKNFVPKVVGYLKKNEKFNLSNLVESNFEKVVAKKEYIYISQNPLNSVNIKALKEECFRIAENLIYQFQNSKFMPIEDGYEIPFEKFGSKATFKVGDKLIRLKGVIDRVDVADSTFRIVDYKTGSDKFSDFTDLYSGKKIQLIVYMDIFARANNNLKPAGAFYLPIKNNFTLDAEENGFMLNGIIENSIENILNTDLNLSNASYASKIIDLKTKKEGGFVSNNTYNNLCVDETQINIIRKFAYDLMEKAIKQIARGVIKPYPLETGEKKSCEYCKFKGICLFDESFDNQTRKVEKITTVDELKNKFYGDN